MSGNTDERVAQRSHVRIQDLVAQTWSVRSETIRALNATGSTDLPRSEKAELHSTVFSYLNALRPYFLNEVTAARKRQEHADEYEPKSRVEQIWLTEPVIPKGPLEIDVLWCDMCDWSADAAQVDLNRADACPDCGFLGLNRDTMEHPTEMEYAAGLQAAEDLYLNVTQHQTTSAGYGGVRATTETRVDLLPANILIHISRLLDEAARELGFLPAGAEVNDGLPILREFDQSGESESGYVERADIDTTPEL